MSGLKSMPKLPSPAKISKTKPKLSNMQLDSATIQTLDTVGLEGITMLEDINEENT